jgi:hypothetical protein
MHPVQCPAPATGAAVRAGHLLRWVAPLCVLRRGNPGFGGWGTSQSTCNNFIADLLFLSEVSYPLLVAGAAPCVHPYLGKWALIPHTTYHIPHNTYHATRQGQGPKLQPTAQCPAAATIINYQYAVLLWASSSQLPASSSF